MKVKKITIADAKTSLKAIWSRVKTWLTVIITCLIVYFIARYIYKNWSQLSTQDWHIEWIWLIISILFEAFFLILRAFTWTTFVRWNGATSSYIRGIWLWFQSSLARYLPLPVFEAGSRIYVATQSGTDTRTAFWSYAAEIFASVVGASLVSLLAMPALSFHAVSLWTVLFLIVFISLVLALIIHISSPILQKIKIPLRVRFGQALIWNGLYMFSFLMQGLAYYFIMKSIQYDSADIPLVIGASTFAWLIGLLNVFSPSGIGTRELVLFYTLQNQFPSQAIIYLGLMARLLGTFTEVGINGGGYLFVLFRKWRVKKTAEGNDQGPTL